MIGSHKLNIFIQKKLLLEEEKQALVGKKKVKPTRSSAKLKLEISLCSSMREWTSIALNVNPINLVSRAFCALHEVFIIFSWWVNGQMAGDALKAHDFVFNKAYDLSL